MFEAYIRTTSVAKFPIIYKSGVGGYYDWHINAATGFLECIINDGTNTATITGDVKVNDGRLRVVRVTLDKSSATGGRLYVAGVEDTSARTDLTSIGNIDNDGDFQRGYDGTDYAVGRLDELRFWNFGYEGLPNDVATYDIWRAALRNVFLDISAFNAGAWNGYADAYRVERLTLGDLDDNNGEFEGAGADGTDITVNTDWVKSILSAEIDDEGGSGITTYNGSDFAVKIHTPGNVWSQLWLVGANFDTAFTVGEWYEVSYDYKVANATNAKFRLENAGAATGITRSLTSITWTTDRFIFQLVGNNDMALRIYPTFGDAFTGNEVLWIDNISIKRIGLVARYKFDGNLLDSGGSNNNDLTEGGTGNVFPGYTLKKNKIIAPDWVR